METYRDYNQQIALHYGAYTPPLHARILQGAPGEKRFDQGLDVGCGTGQSSVALVAYCNGVWGIDQSKAMLARAVEYPGLTYEYSNGIPYPFNSEQFDVVTFAGSLFYAKSPALLEEVRRVSRPEATILIYDFNIPLKGILNRIESNYSESSTFFYQHDEGFSGLGGERLILMQKEKKT